MNKAIDKIIGNTVATPVRMTAGGGGNSEPFVINCTVEAYFMDKMGEYIDDADKTYEEVKAAIEDKQRIIMRLPSGSLIEPSGIALRNDRIEFIVFANYGVRIVDRYICTVDNKWYLAEEYTIASMNDVCQITHGKTSPTSVLGLDTPVVHFNTEDNIISLFSIDTDEDGNEVKEWKTVNDHRPIIITFTTSDDGTISADKSYEEIKSAIISNKNLICVTDDGIAVSVAARGIFEDFICIETFVGSERWTATCTPNDVWTLDVKQFARQDDIEANYVHKDEIGDIEKALLEIEAMADSLIGGDAE